MRKKLVAALLVAAMAVSSFAGCGKGSKSKNGTMQIDVYDVAANVQGTQSGWFAKVVKDRFDIELNIIAPQVAGDAIYQTRTASGNLGDLVLLDAIQFNSCVKAGLIKDITAEYNNSKNLKVFDDAIQTYNKGIEGNDGKIYGIPTEMMTTSPTSYSQDVIYSSPMLRWDYYNELGCPEIKDLNGLLDVLEQEMKAHPTNKDGEKFYPLSLWSDWDGGDGMLGIANVVQLTTWYGEKIKGSAILKPDNTFTKITDKNATYYKLLKFLNTAQQRGLVDPDSGTQDWNAACAKMGAQRVGLMWYSWQAGFTNNAETLANGSAYIFVPVSDQTYYCDSDAYYGSGRVFGVGSKVSPEKYAKIMEFLDWYASPEGATFQHDGIEGFNYTKNADGTYTVMNDDALAANKPVPAEWGGAGYSDGFNAINQWIVGSTNINPLTGEKYASTYWASYKAATMNDMKKGWQARFGAEEPVDWMKKNNKLLVSPSVSVALPDDTNDIALIRNECNKTLCDSSWQMIFAKDDAEFDKMWDEMVTKMDGLNFDQLYKFDCDKHQLEVNAKKAAAK